MRYNIKTAVPRAVRKTERKKVCTRFALMPTSVWATPVPRRVVSGCDSRLSGSLSSRTVASHFQRWFMRSLLRLTNH